MWRFSARWLFSIQKYDAKKDYYKILQLSEQATNEQIKKAFRELAKKYHPDSKTGKEEAFKQINEAHQVLSSQGLRKEYDESRRARPNPTQQDQQHKNSHSNKYRNQNQTYQNKQPPPEQQFYEEDSDKFRQYIRKKHDQQMKKYTQQRHNYDNLGRAYQNYDRFREQALKKKNEKVQQKVKITQQSVRQQQQTYRRYSQQKQQQQREKWRQELKNDLLSRYKRAVSNNENTLKGIKQMGNILKDFFKKK